MGASDEIKDWAKQTIETLVSQNYRIAEALHFLGIRFQDYANYTWEELCQARGLQPDVLVREMQVVGLNPSANNLELIQYPAELVLAYLRHAHHQFIKVRLPFIMQLLDQTDWSALPAESPVQDLKIVFPDFAQDFIWHIYEEEDELFGYIDLLISAVKGQAKHSQVYFAMEKQCIHHHASDHEAHDGEMRGLRQMTNNFIPEPDAPLSIKVLYAELATLERELMVHANIENRILFPKALKLEHEVRYHVLFRSRLN
jgi:regulator of cell morphogenesis and NO signaling